MSMKNADDLYKKLGLGPYQNNPFSLKSDTSYTNFPTEPIAGIKTGEMGDYVGPTSTNIFNREATSNIDGIPAAELFSKDLDLDIVDKPLTQRERARRAFLDTDDSMKALRARDRELGIMYAGGKYYALGDDGEFQKNEDRKTNKAVDSDLLREYTSGTISPQDFKDRFQDRLTSSKASENPFAQEPAPVEIQTEPMIDIGSTEDLGKEFDNQAASDFDNPKNKSLTDKNYLKGRPRAPYMRFK